MYLPAVFTAGRLQGDPIGNFTDAGAPSAWLL
jgi:hypothetical protein